MKYPRDEGYSEPGNHQLAGRIGKARRYYSGVYGRGLWPPDSAGVDHGPCEPIAKGRNGKQHGRQHDRKHQDVT
ncbi:MAG TPA: hypothetical protein VFB63_24110 [Bryobacteraceae bacterium]|nr:hypothetical protein [Bryobacteraceae bacterium]